VSLRCIVVGLGVQGHKRRKFAGADYVGTVDPFVAGVEWRNLADVPLDAYDAALLCVPDDPKSDMLKYLAEHGKHALVEKPLWAETPADFDAIETAARRTRAVVYTAYNHRFEPHYAALRDVIAAGQLGRIYHCRMFYGNGTARLVRESQWRDKGAGVLPDLGSHLLDTLRFWFGDIADDFRIVHASRFENHAPDHVQLAGGGANGSPTFDLEMTLLSWRNHFTCDVYAEKGTAHIASLCKWGPSSLTLRTRVLPSGRPPEETEILVQDDPTWALEYAHFKALCAQRTPADLSNDRWLQTSVERLSKAIK
jgi:scyllo-inositol 2-dehydrogenase (NADP+)